MPPHNFHHKRPFRDGNNVGPLPGPPAVARVVRRRDLGWRRLLQLSGHPQESRHPRPGRIS
eukprot:11634791-Alexandrium_andersonii.AAC.1